jgi:YD repeat-containing protein
MTSRSGWWWCLAIAFLSVVSSAFAQTTATNPEDEYKKLVKVDTEIQPLGENPFGESVNVFDGGLTFHVVDISIPGKGPTIEIGRTFHADGDNAVRWSDSEFGDWDFDYPRLTTLTSNQGTIIQGPNQIGWLVNTLTRTDRCTNFREPPDQRVGRPGSDPLSADAWWNQGYTLQVPGTSDQDMLTRVATSPAAPTVDGLNFVAVSKDRWHLGCLASTANSGEGEPYNGEAFEAVGPNGQKIWLNELFYRPARSFGIIRNLGVMAATRVEDRFGNSLTYNWVNHQLQSIVASDGRTVMFEYAADGKHITKISVVTPADGTRSWTYGYTAVTGGSILSSVTLPDGSSWSYDLSQLTFDVKSPAPSGNCLDVQAQPDSKHIGTITGPSGIQGQFEAHPVRHARSNVVETCAHSTSGLQAAEARPRYTNNLALTSKTISGTAIGTQTWSYQYPLATASWQATCPPSSCDITSQSLVVDPAGNTTRYTFFNSADVDEGKPVKTEYFNGGASGAPVRTESYQYAKPTAGVWPARYGAGFNFFANTDRQEQEAPQVQKDILQDGDTYTWQALQFDAYARPALTKRFSSIDLSFSATEGHTFIDNTDRSIVGLPFQLTHLVDGIYEVVSQNNYDTNLVLASRDHFGQRAMDYTFNAQGQLETFTDPRGNVTRLMEYNFGIPHVITFPDYPAQFPGGTKEIVNVNGFGEVSSIVDQAGTTTSYAYDALGRIARIDYPSGDAVAWAPKLYSYVYSADALGMGGNHWVRTVTQGNRAERTDFDAMLRPVLEGKSEAGTGALYVSTETDYDWKGQKTFVSYPVDGAQNRGAAIKGVHTDYDPIGRVIKTTQASELTVDYPAGLQTFTTYLPGGVRRVADPKGNVVSTAFQGFDAPDSDHPVRVDAFDSLGTLLVTQTITRDSYGDAHTITQGGVKRSTYYDAQHRVCRTDEPETGSEMTAFDAAGNVTWTAAGQPSDDVDRCDLDVVADAAKINRTYDSMNRLVAETYPAGGLALTFGYDLLGKPAQAVSNTGAGNANNQGEVIWTFGRNKLGLLTAEMLQVDHMSWSLGYGYDANGIQNSVQYPDGETVAMSPNALGQPTAAGRFLSGATYWPDGQVKGYTMGNGAVYSSQPNDRQLLMNFTYGTATPAVSEDLHYDAAGNITSIIDQAPDGGQRSRSFQYDGMNRLVRSDANLWGTETYAYDALNNILTMGNGTSTTETYVYDTRNRLASISGAVGHTFEYDLQGNVSKRDGQLMAFDLANRLLSLTGKSDYMYDAAGRRVKTVAGAAQAYYAYSSDGMLMWEFNPASGEGTDYVHLGKTLVASKKNVLAPTATTTVTAPASVQASVAYKVSWTAVNTATSYDLQEQPDGGAWATIETGAPLSFMVTHTAAATFHYQARGCNATGCGPWSTEVTTVVTPSPSAPPSPATVTATPASNQQTIAVTWTASATATYYNVEQRVGAAAWSQPVVVNGTSTSVGSAGDGAYSFQVQACSALGCSGWTLSNTVNLQHTPAAPASINVQNPSAGTIAVSWPTVGYGQTYALQRSTDNANFTDVYYGAAAQTSQTVGASGTYWFRVRACNSTNGTVCGANSPSAASSVTIPPAQAPGISVPGTSNNGCYTVSWNGVAGATSYTMQEQVNGGGFSTIGNDGSGALGICGKGGGTYGYRVQGCNAGGCGPFSGTATVTVSLVPAIPDGIHMEETIVGKSQRYTLSWYATPNATRYEILNIQLNKTVYSGGDLSYRVEAGVFPYDLQNTYRLRACNDQGCSAWSGEISG